MKNDKGFSLVELIVVIAIMAILVGVLAPQLIKYIEKSKVSSDLQTLDTIYQAVVYASNDPDVVLEPASQAEIDKLLGPTKLEDIDTDTLFGKEILDSLDWQDLDRSTYKEYISSSHDDAQMEIYVQYKGGFMNPLAMWATYTDITGKKEYRDNYGSVWTDIGNCICIQ